MKIKLLLPITLLISFFNFSYANAEITITKEINSGTWIEIETTSEIKNEIKVTRSYAFLYFSEFFKDIPSTYRYIDLKYVDVLEETILWDALQKLVYLDKIKNDKSYIYKNKEISSYEFYLLANKILDLNIEINKDTLLNRKLELSDFSYVEKYYQKVQQANKVTTVLWDKEGIFNDVYNSLINGHYDKADFDKEDLIDSAIEWLANWTWDKHTVYFPPIESKDFEDSLSGEYEWIWAYVEMAKPGILKITSPVPDGPAEKAWLKWWDIITKVNDKVLTTENSLQEVISWIKWPKLTTVDLTIKRWEKELVIEVTRDKIVIHNLEYEKLNSRTFYIQIKSFWNWVSGEFKDALNALKEEKWVKKVIIDLRNNGGWFLGEVTQMLWYVVEKWKNTAIVKYNWIDKWYTSSWLDIVDLEKYEIIILQNSGTASASEIMIWTLEDYFDIIKIGETTYWKWSVQTIKYYKDWSSLKYTIAKWFTGWTETGIDWVWINSDINLEFDIDKYEKKWTDNQLERAIYY